MGNHIITLDQVPDNPLDMPPPYWRGSSAIFHAWDALEDISRLLCELIPVHERTELKLNEYYEQNPVEPSNDAELEEFGEICNELWELEEKIKLKAEVAILMSAIQAEEDINKFCVFNLHKDIAESIEGLPPAEKILIASAAIGKTNTKGTTVYEAAKKLSAWRNAFAHGHCVDRPTKSLRHNHLISPPQFPGVPNYLAQMQDLVGCLIRIEDYLRSISVNPYTAGESSEIQAILEYLKDISSFRFKVSPDSNTIYDIEYRKS